MIFGMGPSIGSACIDLISEIIFEKKGKPFSRQKLGVGRGVW